MDKMEKSLKAQFAEGRIAQILADKIASADIIDGANAFDRRQHEIFTDIAAGNKVLEWHVKGKNDVLLLSPLYALPLLKVAGNIPLERTHYQYPSDKFNKVRRGGSALGLEKRDEIRVVMMNKQQVLNLIDPLRQHEEELKAVIEKVESLMDKKGLSSEQVIKLLDTENEPPPP